MDLDADLEVNRKTTESTMPMPFIQLLSDQTRSAQVDNLILVPTLLLITCWIIDKLFLLPMAPCMSDFSVFSGIVRCLLFNELGNELLWCGSGYRVVGQKWW